jgi:hypothetical protein
MRKNPTTWILIMALAGAAAACGDEFTEFDNDAVSDGGAGGATSNGTSAEGGGPVCVDFGDACSACELSVCEQRFCDCYGNADCGLYASCTFECELWDYDCYQACNTKHPEGITDAVLLNDCAYDACASECSDYPLIELTACERCTYDKCEAQMNTCLANPVCTDLVLCVQACGADTECQNACSATFPTGLGDATPVASCAQSQCSSSCDGG